MAQEGLSATSQAIVSIMVSAQAALPVILAVSAAVAAVSAAAYLAHKDMEANDYNYAVEQTKKLSEEYDNLEEKNKSLTTQIESLNKQKENGDFTAQQQVELELLEAQREVLEAQIGLYKDRVKIAKEHERDAARREATSLLSPGPFEEEYGLTLEQAISNYSLAKEKLEERPDWDGSQRLFNSASDRLIRYTEQINSLIKSLDPEEDNGLIESLSSKLNEINNIFGIGDEQSSKSYEKFQKNVKSLSADTVKALASNKDLTRMQKAEFEEWAERVGYVKEDIKDLAIYFQRLLGVDTTGSSGDVISDRIVQAREDLQNVMDEMSRLGISANETIFGNIDADNRQILEWTDENIEKFKDALESWGEDIDALRGEYSTIMGTSSEYDGLEIAFTPILQTDHGPELLSEETVDEYIRALLDKVRNLHENGEWSTEDLLELDARGIEIDGKKIRGVIADVGHAGEESGEKVREIAEAMHFVGKNGELARVTKEFEDAKAAAHDYIQNYIAKDIGDLGSLRDELAKTSKAWEDYNKTLEGGDRGDAAKQMAQAYQKAMEDIENGRIDTKAVWGAAKLLFSDQQLAEWKYDLTRIAHELSGPMMQALFSGGEDDDTEIGVKFANYIKEHAAELEDAGAHILDQGDGRFQFWYDSLGKLAESLGMSEEAVTSLLDALDAYGVQSMQSGEDITKLAEQFRLIRNNSLTAKDAVQEFIKAMATGENPLNEREIIENLKALKANGVITGNDYDFAMMIKEVFDDLEKVDEAEPEATAKLDDQITDPADQIKKHLEELFAEPTVHQIIAEYVDNVSGIIGGLNPKEQYEKSLADEAQTVEDRTESFERSGKTRRQNIETHETVTVTVGADTTPADAKFETLGEEMQDIDEAEVSPTANVDDRPAVKVLNYLWDLLNKLGNAVTHHTVVVDYYDEDHTSGVKTGTDLPGTHASASGTKNAPGGTTLVNELGPELISDDGEAYIANGGKPGFVNLSKGAIVFTADETKEIFRKGYSNVPVRAYAGGTPNRASLRDRLISGERTRGAFTGGVSKVFTCGNCGHQWNYSPIDYPNGPNGYCPKCGAQIINGQTVKGSGNSVDPSHTNDDYYPYDVTTGSYINNYDDTYANYIHQVRNDYKSCPNCGSRFGVEYEICPYCGYNFHTGRMPGKETDLTSKQNVDTSKYKGSQPTTGGSSGYTGSSSYPGSADYASEAEPQKVDWIAVLLNRIQRKIADIEKVASSGFKDLGTRISAAGDEVSQLNKEINAEREAYARYMQEAGSVGLSSDLAELVKNGTIDINEYDDETRKLIDKYSEWYNKCHFIRQRILKNVLNCWNTLRAFQLQHTDEICRSANA